MPINRRIVLARYPQGKVTTDDLRLEEVPTRAPEDGEVLCRTIWLSLDPYMRGRMSTAASYASHVAIGEPIRSPANCSARIILPGC